jgi:AcrR family transcriptional regulator
MDWDHPPELADVRRWQLLAAGRRVIQRKRPDTFTVEDVTRQAKVAKGTFYTYFHSRDEFLDDLRTALAADVVVAVRAAAEGPWDGIFLRVMGAVSAWTTENPGLHGLFGPEYLARRERPTREPMFEVVVSILRAGVGAGVFQPLDVRSGDPIEAAAEIVYDAMSAAVGRAASSGMTDQTFEATSEFVRRALRFDDAAARDGAWTPRVD